MIMIQIKTIFGSKTQEFPGWNLKLASYTEGKERPNKDADHSRLVDENFRKQGNLHRKLVLGGCKRVDLCTCPPES